MNIIGNKHGNIKTLTTLIIGTLLTAVIALSVLIGTAAPITAESTVSLSLAPVEQTVKVGDTFDVAIQAESGSLEVVGIDAYLEFDPSKLAVVDMNSTKSGIQITAGDTLTTVIQNSADNTNGYINYSAGVLGADSYPSGTFTAATIKFEALAETSTATAVEFSTSAKRTTMVSGESGSVITGSLTNGVYTLYSEATTTPTTTTTVTTTTTSSHSSGGGGGGGSSGSSDFTLSTSGLSTTASLHISSKGVSQNTATLTTTDGRASLNIPSGTTLLTSASSPLSIISTQSMASPLAASNDNLLIAAYTFGPSGATFNPAIVLSISYNPADLPEGLLETNLYIAYYDGTGWTGLDSTVDATARVVNARISHFSSYALIGKTTASEISATTAAGTTGATTAGTIATSGTASQTASTYAQATTDQTITSTPAKTATTTQTIVEPKRSPVIFWIIAIVVILAIIGSILIRRKGPTPKE